MDDKNLLIQREKYLIALNKTREAVLQI